MIILFKCVTYKCIVAFGKYVLVDIENPQYILVEAIFAHRKLLDRQYSLVRMYRFGRGSLVYIMHFVHKHQTNCKDFDKVYLCTILQSGN